MKIVPDSLTHVFLTFEYRSFGDVNDQQLQIYDCITYYEVETTSLYISTFISGVDIFEP